MSNSKSAQPDPVRSAGSSGKRQMALTPAKAIQLAGALYAKGKFADAIAVAKDVLRQRPRAVEASNILAVGMAATGDIKGGVALLRKTLKIAPRNPSLHANLGELERRRGQLPEARIALKEALQLHEANPQANNNLGIIYFEMNDYEEAVRHYNRAIQLSPKFPEAHNNLGNALRHLGKIDEAILAYERAISLRPNYPEAYNNLGTSLRDKDRRAEAEQSYAKAIELRPTYVDALVNLAVLLNAGNRPVEALRALGKALRLSPSSRSALLLTARIQYPRQAYDLAEKALALILSQNDKDVEALILLGQIMHDQDKYDRAFAALDTAIRLSPGNGEAHHYRGIALKSVGRLDEARDELLQAVRLNPDLFGAYANLNDLIDYSDYPDLVAKLRETIAAAEDSTSPRYLSLHFALAKALEDFGEPEAAFASYIKGGKAKRLELDYDEEKSILFFDKIKSIFSAEYIRNPTFKGNLDERPVFIVGMPRSGSTLVEQILASHPDIFGAGEVKYLSRGINKLRDRFPGLPAYPDHLGVLEPEHLDFLASYYVDQISAVSGKALRVTDKLLTNYFFVGLIHILFPKAKFIHTRRNAVDTCVSAFTKLFKDDMPHSYDLTELGRYYTRYEALMAHWEAVLPKGVMMTIDYETVVDDLEGSARALTDFVGVPFDEACLAFHTSDRPVKTASLAQVRKPVYTTAIGRWKKYGGAIKPLLDALGHKAEPKALGKKPAPKAPRKKTSKTSSET